VNNVDFFIIFLLIFRLPAPDFCLLTSRLLKGSHGKLTDLTGSLFWATALGFIFYSSASTAAGFLAKLSDQLKPICSGLNLTSFFNIREKKTQHGVLAGEANSLVLSL